MSRTTSTILTNLCLIEDTSTNKVVLQYRSPEKTHWSGYAFTPLLWNPWLYLVVGTILCHIWYRFYRTHAVNWKNVVGLLFSFFASLILVLFIVFFFSFDGHGSVTIHSEYYLKEKSIVFQRGSLLDAYDEYHELVNPFVMKKEIKKKVYID